MKVVSIFLLSFMSFLSEGRCLSMGPCSSPSKNSLQKIEIKMSADSEAMSRHLQAQGFDCGSPPPSFERGYRCRGKVPGYPQSVNIFVPAQYSKKNPGNYAVHFHGHNSNPNDPEVHFNIKTGDGDYGKMLTQSEANSLLVIPESLGKDTTYQEYFKTPQHFDDLLKKVEEKTGITVSSLSLSSHSGGDRTMNLLAGWYESKTPGAYLGKVHSIALFDSLYAQREALARWPQALKERNAQSHFLGSYVVGPGASTTRYMQWLKAKVPPSAQWKYREVKTHHMGIMRDGGFTEYLKYSSEP